jgi:hypothetical protein
LREEVSNMVHIKRFSTGWILIFNYLPSLV